MKCEEKGKRRHHNRMPSASKPNFESTGLALATSLFTVSAVWFLGKIRRDSKHHGPPRHQHSSENYTDRTKGVVGNRGNRALAPPIPYLEGFLKCLGDQCDLVTNPEGHVALCIAENKLALNLLQERFTQGGTAAAAFADESVYCYNSFLGMPVAREAAAYFFARRFLFPERQELPADEALLHIRPSHVALGAGCAALLNNLFYLLGEPGECCLIPIPYYAAFENDMNLVAGIVPFGIHQVNPTLGPSVAELNLAYTQAKAKGLTPKFLLLTNPNNPLGVIYRPEVLLANVQWARKRGLHTISDEIYALSTHQKPGQHGFQSIIKVLDNDLGNDVHMLWAVSKDFGGSGLRVGFVYSQNEIFMEGLATLSIFTAVSGPIQYLVAELLTDDEFSDSFLDESRDRIHQSYLICTNKLQEMVVPFIPAEAGLFVYVDLSSLLPEKTFACEERLSKLMLDHARIVLTPGESQRDTNPGMFRICYTWVSPEVLELAMERMSKLVGKLRRMDWDDLDSRQLKGIL